MMFIVLGFSFMQTVCISDGLEGEEVAWFVRQSPQHAVFGATQGTGRICCKYTYTNFGQITILMCDMLFVNL